MIIYWKETFGQLDSFIDRANARILVDKATGSAPDTIRELKGTHKQLLHEMIKSYGGQLIRTPELFEDGLLPSYKTNNPNLAKKIRRSPRTVQRCIKDLEYSNIIIDKKSFGAKKNIHIRFHPALLIGRTEQGIEAIEKELRQIEKADHEDYLVTLLRTKRPLNETGNYQKESIKDVEENSGGATQLNPEILNDKKLKKLAPEFWRNNLIETGNTRGQVRAADAPNVSIGKNKKNSAAREKSAPAVNTRGQKARTGGGLSRWMRPVADHPTFSEVSLPFTPAARLSELLEKVHFLWVLCFTHLYRNFQFLAVREQIHAKFYFLTKLILAADTEETFKLLQARIVEAGKYCKQHRYTVPVPSAYFDDTGKRAVSFAKTESWITKKYQTHADWEALRDMTAQDMKAYRGLLNALDKTQERGTVRQYKNGLRFLQKYGNEKVTELYNELIIK